MKLIIDIPEKTIAHIRSNYGHGYKGLYDEDRDKIVDAIYHGIPLDDVKAEIQAKYDSIPWQYIQYDDGWIDALEWVLYILDNIGKESEEKVNGKNE